MEENKEYLELLKKIEATNRQQARSSRMQCIFSVITAVCCVVIFILICTFMPQLNAVTDQLQTVLSNLEQITQQLAAIDLEGMVSDVDSLVVTGQQSLKQTMEKLELIDFETLNKAIEDLAAVVEPFAKFFGAF